MIGAWDLALILGRGLVSIACLAIAAWLGLVLRHRGRLLSSLMPSLVLGRLLFVAFLLLGLVAPARVGTHFFPALHGVELVSILLVGIILATAAVRLWRLRRVYVPVLTAEDRAQVMAGLDAIRHELADDRAQIQLETAVLRAKAEVAWQAQARAARWRPPEGT